MGGPAGTNPAAPRKLILRPLALLGFGQVLVDHFIAFEDSPLVHAEAAAGPVAPETREIRRWFGSGHSVIIAIENACFDTDPPFIIL